MNSNFIIMIIALILVPSFLFIAYANTERCFSGRLIDLYPLKLDEVIECLDDRIDNAENRITVLETSGTDLTTASNIGTSGVGVFSSEIGNDLQFKKLISSNNATLGITSNGTNVIFIPTAGGESTVCNNLGTNGIIVCTGGNVNLRKFISANNATLSIQANSTNVILENKSPDDTVCANVGSGSQVFKDGECNFRSIIGSSDISVTQQTNTITVDFNGTLPLLSQQAVSKYESLTKTNIGTSYVSIYTSAFNQEFYNYIDFTNVNSVRIFYLWDYVGTGTQSLKWCQQGIACTGSEILFEVTTITTDCGSSVTLNPACDSGWFSKPVDITGTQLIRWEGKSTVAGDDPIAKGYIILVR